MRASFTSSDFSKQSHTISYAMTIDGTDVTEYIVKFQPHYKEQLANDIFGILQNQQFNFFIIDNAATRAILAVGAEKIVKLTTTLDGQDIVLVGQTMPYFKTEYQTATGKIREVVCQVMAPYYLENTYASLFMHSVTVGTEQVAMYRNGYDIDLDITVNTIVETGVHTFHRKYNSGEYYKLNDGEWVPWDSAGINLTDSAGNDIDLNDNTGFKEADEIDYISRYFNTAGNEYSPATYEKVNDIESNIQGLSKDKTNSTDLGSVATDLFSTSPLGIGIEADDVTDIQWVNNGSASKSFLVLADGAVKFITYEEDLDDYDIVTIDSSRTWHRIYFHRKDTSNYIISMVRVDSASDVYIKRYNLPSTALQTGSATLLEETNLTPTSGYNFWNDPKNISFAVETNEVAVLEWDRRETASSPPTQKWYAKFQYENLDDASTHLSGEQTIHETGTNPHTISQNIYGFCYGIRYDDDSQYTGYALFELTYTDDSVTGHTETLLSLIAIKGSITAIDICTSDFTAKLVSDEAEQGWCEGRAIDTGTLTNEIDELYFENFYYSDLSGTPTLQEASNKFEFSRVRRPIYHSLGDYWAVLLTNDDDNEISAKMIWIDNDDLESYTQTNVFAYYQDTLWYNVPSFISVKTPGIVWGSGTLTLQGLDGGGTDILILGEETQFSPTTIQALLISKNFKYVYPYFKVEKDALSELDVFCNSMMLFVFIDYENLKYTYKELEDIYNATGITTDLTDIASELFITKSNVTFTGIKILNEDTGQEYLKGEAPYEEVPVNIWHQGQMKRIAEVLYDYYTNDSVIECKGVNFLILDLFDVLSFDSTDYFVKEYDFVDNLCKITLIKKVTL